MLKKLARWILRDEIEGYKNQIKMIKEHYFNNLYDFKNQHDKEMENLCEK